MVTSMSKTDRPIDSKKIYIIEASRRGQFWQEQARFEEGQESKLGDVKFIANEKIIVEMAKLFKTKHQEETKILSAFSAVVEFIEFFINM